MSTIGSLLLALGQGGPAPYGDIAAQTASTRGRELGNETALLKLAELKRSQASEQEVMRAIQNDPALARLIFGGGGSTLGALPTTGAPPGAPPAAGPLTQQTTMPGQPPGAPQVVPGGQDLSRFANVSPQGGGPIPAGVMAQTMPTVTPPPGTPTLATIGPQGGMPGPQQPPQNPLLEMARKDPRAALMLQQQLEERQDAAMKRQEQRLKIGEATLGYVGQQAQGVTDQASLDALRSDLQGQGLQQYAAQLPQLYSKAAMQPFIDKAVDVKNRLTLDIAAMKEQTDLRAQRFKEQQAAGTIPEYVKGEGPLNAWIDTLMQRAGIPRGTTPPPEILEQAQQNVQEGKIAVSAAQGQGQLKDTSLGVTRIGKDNKVEFVRGPNGEILQPKPSEIEQRGATLANSVAAANTLATALEEKGYKPSVWDKGLDKLPLGLGNYVTSSDYQKYRQAVNEFASAWLYGVSGAQINDDEWERANQTFFPQPNEDKAAVELKRLARARLVEQLRQQTQATGRTGTQAPPTSQGTTGAGGQAGGKVVTRAALQAENARRNEANRAAGRPEISNEQAEAMAKQKGYTVQ